MLTLSWTVHSRDDGATEHRIPVDAHALAGQPRLNHSIRRCARPSSHTAHTPGHLFSVSNNSLRRAADGSRRHFREPCALSKQTRACRCASACAECCSDESAFNCIFFSRRHSACCAAVRPGHDGRLSISVTRPVGPSALTALSGVARCRLGFNAESHSKRECFSVESNRTQAQHGTKCGAQVLNLNSFTDVELRDRRYVFCGVRWDGSEAQARAGQVHRGDPSRHCGHRRGRATLAQQQGHAILLREGGQEG